MFAKLDGSVNEVTSILAVKIGGTCRGIQLALKAWQRRKELPASDATACAAATSTTTATCTAATGTSTAATTSTTTASRGGYYDGGRTRIELIVVHKYRLACRIHDINRVTTAYIDACRSAAINFNGDGISGTFQRNDYLPSRRVSSWDRQGAGGFFAPFGFVPSRQRPDKENGKYHQEQPFFPIRTGTSGAAKDGN